MNDKLKVWCREDANLEACPSFSPMTQTDIDNYLNNGIGTEENITLGKILTPVSYTHLSCRRAI